MIKQQIFTYWEGPIPPYIEHCLSTFERSGVTVYKLNKETVDQYMFNTLHPNWKRLDYIAQKTDCIRLALIYNHGGMWVDADTIFIKECSHLFDNDNDFNVTQWSIDNVLCNAYFSAPKGSNFIRCALNHINHTLENNFKPRYMEDTGVYFGETTFQMVRQKMKVDIFPLSTFLPVEFRGSPGIWNKQISIQNYIHPNTVAIGLNHSQYGNDIYNMSIEQFYNQHNLFGDVFKFSMDLRK